MTVFNATVKFVNDLDLLGVITGCCYNSRNNFVVFANKHHDNGAGKVVVVYFQLSGMHYKELYDPFKNIHEATGKFDGFNTFCRKDFSDQNFNFGKHIAIVADDALEVLSNTGLYTFEV